MKRTQKIQELWKNLTRNSANAYVPPNLNKDAQSKKNITTGLLKLNEKAKQGLTENTPEGLNFLKQRNLTGLVMRNYCRSLKAIKNKAYLKRVKGLTAVVMGLTLANLDAEDGLGSEAGLDNVNVAALDAELLKADEPEPIDAADPAVVAEPQAGAQQANATAPNAGQAQGPAGSRPRAGGPASEQRAQAARAAQAQANNNGPPARPGSTAPQTLPPEILRERSAAAMTQKRREHNRDRQGKLAELSKTGAAFFASSYSAKLAPLEKDAGPEFVEVMKTLRACEQGLTTDKVTKLEQDARRYLAHFEKLGTVAKNMPASQAKKKACEQILGKTSLAAGHAAQKELGPAENWGLAEEHRAGATFAKLLFESGDEVGKPGDKPGTRPTRTVAKPNKVEGKETANGSWWVEKQVGDGTKGKKKFIFKPAEIEGEVTGFPQGGSACREVLGKAVADKLQALTGLDFGAPETLLVNVAKDRLDGFKDNDPGTHETVGSMQHFSKSDGEFADLVEKDPTILARIPKEECQKMAILDLVSLNMDRHTGNFMVADEPGGRASLIPIDHGLVLPSRKGLRQRANRMGPPNTALSKIPAAEEPFTPEMAALVAAIDPEEVVKGMKEAQEVMRQQFPGVAAKAEIEEENYNLVKRSCQFLKAGVAAGLSPGELSDAYLRHQDAIFDTPEDGLAVAFPRVIQDVQAASPLRKQALQALPTPDDCLPVAENLVALGWNVPSPTREAKSEAKAGLHQLLLTNPVLYDLQQRKMANPLIQQELAELEAKCRGLEGVDVDSLRRTGSQNPPDLCERFQAALDNSAKRARAKQAEADEQQLPGKKFAGKGTVKDVYAECFLADGGAAQLANPGGNPQDNLKAYMDAAEARYAQNGVAAGFKQLFPEKVQEAPVARDPNHPTREEIDAHLVWQCKQFQALRGWAEYQAEGGNAKYDELGCDKSITVDLVKMRLKELRRAKKLQVALAALDGQAAQNGAAAGTNQAEPTQATNGAAAPAGQPGADPTEAIKKQIMERLPALGERLKKLDFSPVRASGIEQWNQAVVLAKEGKLTDALELLDGIEAKLPAAAPAQPRNGEPTRSANGSATAAPAQQPGADPTEATKKQLLERLPVLSARLKKLEFSPVRASGIEQWNQALVFAKEGKLTDALELLDGIEEKLAVGAA